MGCLGAHIRSMACQRAPPTSAPYLTSPHLAPLRCRHAAVVRRLKGCAVTRHDQAEESTDFTHLLLPERDALKTVIKVLLALAAGKPIVSPAWLKASVRAGEQAWCWRAGGLAGWRLCCAVAQCAG